LCFWPNAGVHGASLTRMGETPGFGGNVEIEQKILEQRFQAAANHATDMNQRSVQTSIEIAKEKTQFFEKVILGCGATVTLIVSFVGAHAGRLQPRWLLRASLISLVLGIVSGLYRNWKVQWYYLASARREDRKALLAKEQARKSIILTGRARDTGDGQLIDPITWVIDHAKDENALLDEITKLENIEKDSFALAKTMEYVTLSLSILGVALLVALAWVNF